MDNILAVKHTQKDTDAGILVIDPNKVIIDVDKIGESGNVKHRYVKQEELMIYANLKAIVKPMDGVIVNTGGNNNTTSSLEAKTVNVGELKFNLLNPQDKIDGKYEYTDIFSETYYNYDGIGYGNMFGIESITITQNASIVPTVNITFIDIQGKALMERGNDELNPYNLFTRFPYPQFLLTVKGYYGSTIDYPLYLLKQNITFDPSSGNYKIDCEFLSRTFAIFNSFFNIYGLVVPYLIKLEDGKFLGNELLKKLFAKQNDEIRDKYAGQTEIRDALIIDGAPSVIDLYNCIDKLSEANYIDDDNTIKIRERISLVDTLVASIGNTSDNIIRFKQDNVTDALQNSLSVLENTLNELLSIESINIKKFDFTSFVNNSYDANRFIEEIEKVKTGCEDYIDIQSKKLVNLQVVNIKNKIGFEPNIRNINRILLNSMEIFLHLLSEVSKSAISQLTSKTGNRVSNQKNNGEFFKDDSNITRMYPFPNYYVKDKESLKKVFPGTDVRNEKWSEVYFVNEIYAAINRLEESMTPNQKENLLNQKESGFLFTNQKPHDRFVGLESEDLLYEILYDAYGYFVSKGYNWLDYGVKNNDNLTKLVHEFIDYEMSLMASLFINKDGADKNEIYSKINDLKNIIGNDGIITLIGYVKKNMGETNFNNFNIDVTNLIKDSNNSYAMLNVEFDKIIAKYPSIPKFYKRLFRFKFNPDQIDRLSVIQGVPETSGYYASDIERDTDVPVFSIDATKAATGIRKYLDGSVYSTSFNSDIKTPNGQMYKPLTWSLNENQQIFIDEYHTPNTFQGKNNFTKLVKNS